MYHSSFFNSAKISARNLVHNSFSKDENQKLGKFSSMIKSGTTKDLKLYNFKEGRNDQINSIQKYPSNEDGNMFKSSKSISNLIEGDLSLIPNVETPVKAKLNQYQNKMTNKLSGNVVFEKIINQLDFRDITSSPKANLFINKNTKRLQNKFGVNSKFITSGYNSTKHFNTKNKNFQYSKFIKVSTPRSKINLIQLNSPKADFQSQTIKNEENKKSFSIKVISPNFNISDSIKVKSNEKALNPNKPLEKGNSLSKIHINNQQIEKLNIENMKCSFDKQNDLQKTQNESNLNKKSNFDIESNDINKETPLSINQFSEHKGKNDSQTYLKLDVEKEDSFQKDNIVSLNNIKKKDQNEFILPLELSNQLLKEELPIHKTNKLKDKSELNSKKNDQSLELNIINENSRISIENKDEYVDKLKYKQLNFNIGKDNLPNFADQKNHIIQEKDNKINKEDEPKNDKFSENINEEFKNKYTISKSNEEEVLNVQKIDPKINTNIFQEDQQKQLEKANTELNKSANLLTNEVTQKESKQIDSNNFENNNLGRNFISNIVEEVKDKDILLNSNKSNSNNIYDEYLPRFEDKEMKNPSDSYNKIYVESGKKFINNLNSKSNTICGLDIMNICFQEKFQVSNSEEEMKMMENKDDKCKNNYVDSNTRIGNEPFYNLNYSDPNNIEIENTSEIEVIEEEQEPNEKFAQTDLVRNESNFQATPILSLEVKRKVKVDDKLGLQNNLNDISLVSKKNLNLNKSFSSLIKPGIIISQNISEGERRKDSIEKIGKIVKIQSFVRKFLYKKAWGFRNILLKKQKFKSQIIKVKNLLTKSFIRKKMEKLRMQIKKQNSDTFKEYRNYCAIIIQKNFKGFIERMNYKNVMIQKSNLLSKILSAIKGWKIRKIMKDEKIIKLKKEIQEIHEIQEFKFKFKKNDKESSSKKPTFFPSYSNHLDILFSRRKQKIIELISLINAYNYTFDGVLKRQSVGKFSSPNLNFKSLNFNPSNPNLNLNSNLNYKYFSSSIFNKKDNININSNKSDKIFYNNIKISKNLNPNESRIKIKPGIQENFDDLGESERNKKLSSNFLSKTIKVISNQKNQKNIKNLKNNDPPQELGNKFTNEANTNSRNENFYAKIKSFGEYKNKNINKSKEMDRDRDITNRINYSDGNVDSNSYSYLNSNSHSNFGTSHRRVISNFIKLINKDTKTFQTQPFLNFLKRKSKQIDTLKHQNWKNWTNLKNWKNVPNKVECWNNKQGNSKFNSKIVENRIHEASQKDKDFDFYSEVKNSNLKSNCNSNLNPNASSNPIDNLTKPGISHYDPEIKNLIEYGATFRYKKLFNLYISLHSVDEIPSTYFKKINKKTKIPSFRYNSKFLMYYNDDSYLDIFKKLQQKYEELCIESDL